jgi:steroid delta-isomerase-like uncharacterized protein
MSSDLTTHARDVASAAPRSLAEASRQILEQGFNEGKLDLVDQLVSPEAVNHDPAEPAHLRGVRGPQVFKRTVEMYRAAFPDVQIIVDDVIAVDDKVVLRWHSEGTHRNELEGLAPTGARVSLTGMSVDRWKDGKVVESWSEWDNLGLARQLGAIPPEGSIGEKIGTRLQHLTAHRMRSKNKA